MSRHQIKIGQWEAGPSKSGAVMFQCSIDTEQHIRKQAMLARDVVWLIVHVTVSSPESYFVHIVTYIAH